MRFGFVVPYADSREFSELAALAEHRGWDGILTWEALGELMLGDVGGRSHDDRADQA